MSAKILTIEFQWLDDRPSLKEGLQEALHCSGQLLKRHFSSKQLSHPQKARDVVRLPLDLANHMQLNPNYDGPEALILKETKEYLAVHKPPFIHSHPLRYSDTNTLLNFLVKENKWGGLNVNQGNYDRGLLFRLDYETSGVLVLAKTEALYQKMRQGFHEGMKQKLYWAVVDGNFHKEGDWTHYFRSTGIKGAKQKVSDAPEDDAQIAKLQVKSIQEHQGKTLLLIHLKTGLRHQIRAQLAALGFPILGDELYGGRKADRLFLHAWRYEWGNEFIEDERAELFDGFFDLNSALQVCHDVLRVL